MNDSYDSTVLYEHSLLPYRPFTAMLVWSVFFSILPKCLFVIIVIYEYFIDISQGSVETHLSCCGGICNNHVIANCPQSVPVNAFWKLVNNWWWYGQKESATFLWPTCTTVLFWSDMSAYLQKAQTHRITMWSIIIIRTKITFLQNLYGRDFSL